MESNVSNPTGGGYDEKVFMILIIVSVIVPVKETVVAS